MSGLRHYKRKQDITMVIIKIASYYSKNIPTYLLIIIPVTLRGSPNMTFEARADLLH